MAWSLCADPLQNKASGTLPVALQPNSNLLEISPINQELGQDRVPGEESTPMTAGYRATHLGRHESIGLSPSSESGSMRIFSGDGKGLTEEDVMSICNVQSTARKQVEFPLRSEMYVHTTE